jgi:uncharacterized protein
VRRLLLLTAGLVLLGAAPAAAIPPATAPPAVGAPYPAPAVCVDTADELGAAVCARITRVLEREQRTTGDEIAVAVVRTTGSASIEDWSTGLFNAWGVGRAGEDDGVLLVVAMDDRALRIATGDGLRDRLPGGRAGEIVGGTILPLMREARTRDAVLTGLDAIRTALGHDIAGSALADPGTRPLSDDAPPEPAGNDGAWLWLLLLTVVVVAGLIWSSLHPSAGAGDDGTGSGDHGGPRRSYPPRRSFGSSSSSRRSSSSSSRRSSFGGGRSSGGGASGRW